MGKRGPAPTPTATKKARGNPGRRKLNAKEPSFAKFNPKAPTKLTQETRKEWDRIVPELSKQGVVTVADYNALVAGFEAYDDYIAVRKKVKQDGRVIWTTGSTGHDVMKVNPNYEVMKDSWKRYVDMLKEFGMTPSSRSRVTRAESNKEEDPFAEYDGKLVVHQGGKK